MPKVLAFFKARAAYAFIAVAAVWLGIAFLVGSLLVLWPVLTCAGSGILLKKWPGQRLTWAWATSTAVLGLLLSAYQASVAAPLVTGTFSSIAAISLAGFTVFALVHIFLLYAGYSPGGSAD